MNIDKLKSLMINDEGFAFDPRSGHTYNINEVGMEVISLLKENHTAEEITDQLVVRFNVDQKTMQRDLDNFLQQLTRYRMIEISEVVK